MMDWDIFYLAGQTPLAELYTARLPYFMYMPWAALLLRPFSLIPAVIGRELFRAMCAAIIAVVAVKSSGGDRWAAAIAATSGWNAVNLLLPQWEAITLLGFMLAQSCAPLGVLLLLTKPRNVALTLLYLLARRRNVRWAALAVAPTLVALAIVTPLAGLDWPVRYILNLNNHPSLHNVSLWNHWPVALCLIAVVLIKRRNITLASMLALDVALCPLVAGYHLMLFTPALSQVAQKNKVAGLILWALSIIPVFAISNQALWSVGLFAVPFVALLFGDVK